VGLADGGGVVLPLVDDDAEVAEGFDGGLHVAAELGLGGGGCVVGFFEGDDAAVGPGGLGDGVERGGQVGGADVEVLAAGSDGTKQAADPEVGGVGVGDGNVEGDHGALDGEVRVLPYGEGADGHVAAFGGERDLLEVGADGVGLAVLGGGR